MGPKKPAVPRPQEPPGWRGLTKSAQKVPVPMEPLRGEPVQKAPVVPRPQEPPRWRELTNSVQKGRVLGGSEQGRPVEDFQREVPGGW